MGTVIKNRGTSCVGVRKTGTTLIHVSTVMGTLYIEHICPQFDAWIIDVRTLEYILADTVGKGRFDYFVDYVKKRKNGYGLVEVQSGEEILVYNLYKQFPVLFEKNYGDIGISVHI